MTDAVLGASFRVSKEQWQICNVGLSYLFSESGERERESLSSEKEHVSSSSVHARCECRKETKRVVPAIGDTCISWEAIEDVVCIASAINGLFLSLPRRLSWNCLIMARAMMTRTHLTLPIDSFASSQSSIVPLFLSHHTFSFFLDNNPSDTDRLMFDPSV